MWERPFNSIADDEGPVPLDWPYWDLEDDVNDLTCKKMFLGWTKIHDNLRIWDYLINYNHFLAPMPNIEVMGKNIKFYAQHGVNAVMFESSPRYHTERDDIRGWVFAKLMWDPSRDTHTLIQDFIYGFYGKAAPAIAGYNQMLWELGKQKELLAEGERIRYGMDVPWLKDGFVEQAKPFFDEAEALAENDEIRGRVELARLSIMYVELSHLYEQLEKGRTIVNKEYYLELLDNFARIAKEHNIRHRNAREKEDSALPDWIEILRKAAGE